MQVRDERDNIVVLDDETRDLIDSLRKNPEMKMLFSVSKGATKEDIIKTIKIIHLFVKTLDFILYTVYNIRVVKRYKKENGVVENADRP